MIPRISLIGIACWLVVIASVATNLVGAMSQASSPTATVATLNTNRIPLELKDDALTSLRTRRLEEYNIAPQQASVTDTVPMFELRVSFTDFNATTTAEPNRKEISIFVCACNTFFQNKFRVILEEPNLEFDAQNVDWTFSEEDDFPFRLAFVAHVSNTEETTYTPDELLERFSETNHFETFISDFEENAFPLPGNIFHDMETVTTFSGVGLPPLEAQIPSARQVCVWYDDDEEDEEEDDLPEVNRVPHFVVQMAFMDGTYRVPSEMEIQALICESNNFFVHHLQNLFDDPSLQFDANNINLLYNYGTDYPLRLSFNGNIHNMTETRTSKEILETLFENGDPYSEYILGFPWYIYEIPNIIFYEAREIRLEASIEDEGPGQFRSATALCMETSQAPSFSPTVSPSPTQTPTVSSRPTTSAAPSPLPSDSIGDDRVEGGGWTSSNEKASVLLSSAVMGIVLLLALFN